MWALNSHILQCARRCTCLAIKWSKRQSLGTQTRRLGCCLHSLSAHIGLWQKERGARSVCQHSDVLCFSFWKWKAAVVCVQLLLQPFHCAGLNSFGVSFFSLAMQCCTLAADLFLPWCAKGVRVVVVLAVGVSFGSEYCTD